MAFRYIIPFTLLATSFAAQKPFWIEDESHLSVLNTSVLEPPEYMPVFAGITTFAHLPFVECMNPKYTEEAHEKFDIAIVGAPFDTSVTNRPGYVFLRLVG